MSMDLVRMTKAGEVLQVHPTCVAAHALAGWRVCSPDQPLADQPLAGPAAPAVPVKPGRRRSADDAPPIQEH